MNSSKNSRIRVDPRGIHNSFPRTKSRWVDEGDQPNTKARGLSFAAPQDFLCAITRLLGHLEKQHVTWLTTACAAASKIAVTSSQSTVLASNVHTSRYLFGRCGNERTLTAVIFGPCPGATCRLFSLPRGSLKMDSGAAQFACPGPTHPEAPPTGESREIPRIRATVPQVMACLSDARVTRRRTLPPRPRPFMRVPASRSRSRIRQNLSAFQRSASSFFINHRFPTADPSAGTNPRTTSSSMEPFAAGPLPRPSTICAKPTSLPLLWSPSASSAGVVLGSASGWISTPSIQPTTLSYCSSRGSDVAYFPSSRS